MNQNKNEMIKFSYTALSSQNQKLTGVMEADSLDSAQAELHKMGFSILAINEISEVVFEEQKKQEEETRKKEGIITFSFKAKDTAGKEINGTIDSKNAYTAFLRLSTEYRFRVMELYPSDASEQEKAQMASRITEFAARMKAEKAETGKPEKTKDELDETEEKTDKNIVAEIDHFIINTKTALANHKNRFTPPFLAQIEKTLGELERIRTSNNLKHISEMCNELYELISHPDKETAGEADSAYKGIVNNLKDNALVRRQFDFHAQAVGLSKIRFLFKKILKKLKLLKEPVPEGPLSKKPEPGPDTWIRKLFKKRGPKPEVPYKPPSSLAVFFKKLYAFFTAPNPILRQTRKQELGEAWKTLKKPKAAKPKIAEEPKKENKEDVLEKEVMAEAERETAEPEKPVKNKWDFTLFFQEADSFLGWLMAFYIAYFFMADFALEKEFGVPREFVMKTLKTPLLFNIALFLLAAHFLLRIKDRHFRHNLLGSLFLFFFGFGLYALAVINF
ncbi:hypothetical protein JXA05_04335 [Candidatus Peregrinibacteria bacterium]|nr:hypothetical protein [Candidatus Peregrinibacteria bacterium]